MNDWNTEALIDADPPSSRNGGTMARFLDSKRRREAGRP